MNTAQLEEGRRGRSRFGPAYAFETDRLVGRCWSPADAPAYRAALDANDAHLRPYIPWMREEPKPLEATLEKLRRSRALFDSDRDYKYGVFERGGDRIVGEVVLLSRAGPGALEVGYWVDRQHVGRGYGVEAAAAAVRIAFEVQGVERVELHHSAENVPSATVARRLGFTLDGTYRRRARDSDDVVRDLTTWSMFADEYPASPARARSVHAYDCLGSAIPLLSTR